MNEQTNEQTTDNGVSVTASKMIQVAAIAFILFVAWKAQPIIGNTSSGPEPKAHITGPEFVRVGVLVVLYGDASVGGTAFEWEGENVETRAPATFETIKGTRNIRPATEPGVWKYRLKVWNNSKISTEYHTLVVTTNGQPQPQPVNPTPDPVNPVQPVKPVDPLPVDPVKPVQPVQPVKPVDPVQPNELPQGKYGAAKKIHDFMLLVTDPQRADVCRKLAASCRDISQRIRSGEITVLNAAVFEIAKALGDLSETQYKSFRSQVSGFLQPWYLNGQLKTTADLATLLDEAAVGLDVASRVP